MAKGCQRRIYYMKNTDSRLFDEAYFVMKKRTANYFSEVSLPCSDRELSEEANRIVHGLCRECMAPEPVQKGFHGSFGKVAAFILGAASSSALIGAAALLVVYL